MAVKRLLVYLLLLLTGSAFAAQFGDIPANLTLNAGTSVRRNAGNSAFEAFTPGSSVWGAITGTLSNQTDLQNALNAKQNTLTLGNISDVGTDGLSVSGGTGAIVGSGVTLSQHVADATHSGYLSSTDWNSFSTGAAGGTVTSFSAGTLSPLFTTTVTNPTTTPALSFTLSNATSHTFFANNTGSTGAPSFTSFVAGTNYEVPLTFSTSVSRSTNTVTLLNDSSPAAGARYFYGQDAGGTKGWQPFIDIGGGGSGNVTGPGSSTDNAVVRWDGTSGQLVQNSTATIDDSGNLTSTNSPNWDTAYADRLKWDGGATGLTAATGRTSLGATTVGSNIFTLTNPSAITFLKIAADNSVSTESASTHRTSLGATTVGSNIFTVPDPSAIRFLKVNADNTVTLEDASTMLGDLGGTGSGIVSDTAFASSWNGVTGTAPSKNAVYDEIHLFDTADDGTIINAGTGFRIGGAAASGKILRGDGTNFVASTSTFPNSASTSGKVLLSDGTNFVTSTPTFPNASATSGKTIRSDGTNWIASTATLSDAPSTAGKVVVSDGTNWITSTPTFPNASATSGKLTQSDGTNWVASTATWPTTVTSGKIVYADGTNYVMSTPTFPASASATSGKIIKSDGTNWTASTETYAAPGTSGNVLTSDGTNWTSAAASGGATGANPTAKVGTSVVNGSASTFLRSDGAPPIDQTIDLAMTAAQTETVSDAATTTMTTVLTLGHNSSGTPAADYGTALLLLGKSNTTTNRNMGKIEAGWKTATDASRSAYLQLDPADNGGFAGSGWRVYKSGFCTNDTQADGGAAIINSNTGYRVGGATVTTTTILQGNGSTYVGSTATWPTSVTSGKIVYANGTNYVMSTPTFPASASATSGKVIQSDGTNWLGQFLLGTTTNDNAPSGGVGEEVESLIASGSATSLTTATAKNITSISLTAGDWDVSGNVNFTETTSTVTARSAGVTSTSATVPTDGSESYCGVQSTVTSETNTITIARKRFSLSGTTTVYLVGSATFSAGTCSGFGAITARRVR